MKATVDIPDALYRQVKAKSALEGRPVREVAVELFQAYVARTEAPTSAQPPRAGERAVLADGRPAPAWFGLARRYMHAVQDHGMDAVRESIGRGRSQELADREIALRKTGKR